MVSFCSTSSTATPRAAISPIISATRATISVRREWLEV
jgi:hypothetical protein